MEETGLCWRIKERLRAICLMISWFGKRAKDPQLRLTVIKVPYEQNRVFRFFGCLELEMERDQRNR